MNYWIKKKSHLYLNHFGVYLGFFVGMAYPVDGDRFGSICKHQPGDVATEKFLQLFDRGQDCLYKPPMLFWAEWPGDERFGINDVANRLP